MMIIRPCGVLLKEGTILFLEYEYSGKKRFNLPGGNHEPGETIEACLIREFEEELGVQVTVNQLLFVLETLAGGRETLHMVFAVEKKAGEFKLDKNHTTALSIAWLEPKDLANSNLYPAVEKELNQHLQGKVLKNNFLGRVEQPWF